MRLNHNGPPVLPIRPSAGVNTKLLGGGLLGPSELTAFGGEAFRQGIGSRRFRVVAEEPNYP